jgi:CRP/FNR family transcriptional regulator, anaerobic regulatory protein
MNTPSIVNMEVPVWRDNLTLVQQLLPFTRRVVHAGDSIYEGGSTFGHLHVINSGQFKTVNFTADGRGQVVGLHFRGDWLGFDGIADGRYGCDAIALDTGEVWSVRYVDVLTASAGSPELMRLMHAAMSRQIARGCDSLLSLGTLPADARVADFIKDWAQSLASRGLRTDQITLHMTRAEIGNYLGMTLETVSRALRRLAQCGVIRFDEKGRRDLTIPSLDELDRFIRSALEQGAGTRLPAAA